MFAVDHALTALLIKRRYREAPLASILLSVQAMELAWVALNYCGIERTDTHAHAIVGNLLNASFLSSAIAGPEELLGGHPLLVVSVVLVQIAITLAIVHVLTGRDDRADASTVAS